MLRHLLAIILLLFSVSGFSQQEYSTADDLTKLIARGGDSALFLFRRAEIYLRTNQPALALADLELIHATDPQLVYAVDRSKVFAFSKLGRVEEAIKISQRLLNVAPDDANLRFNLAALYHISKDHIRAVSEYTWLIEHHPREVIGYSMRAISLLSMKDLPGAKRDLDMIETFSMDSLRIEVLGPTSMLFNAIGEFKKGNAYADKALELDSSAMSYMLKGWSLWGLKSYKSAITLFTKSISLEPLSDAYLYRGKSYFAIKSYTKAEVDFRRSIELDSSKEEAYAFLGYIYQNNGKMKDACDCWRKGLKIEPGSDIAHDIEVYCK